MDQQTDLHYDSNIINCDDIPDTISITSTPEKHKKSKKKCKRKIYIYNMDNLLITRKLKIKKKKCKCVLNVNTCEESSGSIVRSAYNVCKKEAYYQRILPICLRDMCSDNSNCCRSTLSRREKQIDHFYPAREYTSTPMSKIDYIPTPSPYSIDTDKKSIHSDTTMILQPLSEAYSPTASIDAILDDVNNDMIDINLPYSPTMTPDLIKMGNMDYSPVRIDDNVPYSPTFTPESIEIDYEPSHMNAPSIFSPVLFKMEKDNITTSNNLNGNKADSPTMTGMEKPKTNINDSFNMNACENVRYSPNSLTVTPDFHKFAVTTQMDSENNPNVTHSVTTMIKQENINVEFTINNYTRSPNSTILSKDLIKRETCEEYNGHY
ncbi:uncharacterized protein LOC134748351 isoform X2 [Cydia strobilella]|uniref:uncharacterized protein LOC134748351 isoform X2 n=1 Tax=Cydia strobilella TaxID=1100964 RepID=UPI00300740EC